MKPQTLSWFVTKLKLIDFYPHYESSSFIQLTNFAGRRANLDDPRFFSGQIGIQPPQATWVSMHGISHIVSVW
jgi:hypothetical protein